MHAKVDGKRVDEPLRATEELANEDLAEARRGTTCACVEIGMGPKKTASSLGGYAKTQRIGGVYKVA